VSQTTFVCSKCKEVVRNSWEQIERRIEYRLKANNGRHRVLLDCLLCIKCADAEVDAVRKGDSSGEQSALF
jgi:hypothetical protein